MGLDGFFGWILIRILLDGWKRMTLYMKRVGAGWVTNTATPITAGSKSTSPTVLGTVGFKSMVIAGPSLPVPEPAVMEGFHHRRFINWR